MLKIIKKLDDVMQGWENLSLEEKQTYATMAGIGAGLFVRGLLKMKHSNKEELEVIKILVKKDSDVMIFVKGGK